MQVLEAGTCGCLDSDLTSGDDYKEIMASMIFMDSYIGDFDEDTQRKVVASLCNGLSNDGDHLQVIYSPPVPLCVPVGCVACSMVGHVMNVFSSP